MSNSRATGKKAKHGENLVQRTRAAVLGAFDAIEKRGKVLSDILADEFEKNPVKFMELASKLMPKERHVSGSIEHDHTHTVEPVSAIDQRIDEIRLKAKKTNGSSPKPH